MPQREAQKGRDAAAQLAEVSILIERNAACRRFCQEDKGAALWPKPMNKEEWHG